MKKKKTDDMQEKYEIEKEWQCDSNMDPGNNIGYFHSNLTEIMKDEPIALEVCMVKENDTWNKKNKKIKKTQNKNKNKNKTFCFEFVCVYR